MDYRTLWVVRHVMPDDRLVHATVDADDGVIALALRYGHIHPALARSMADFSKEFAETGLFDLDPAHVVERPEVQAWFERVDGHHTVEEPMQVHVGGIAPTFFNVLVHEDLAGHEIVRELNAEVMPFVCGMLVPVTTTDHSET